MVALGFGNDPFIDELTFPGEPRRATIKAHPSALRRPRPYGIGEFIRINTTAQMSDLFSVRLISKDLK
jgi:hypothetical protein